MSYYALTDSDWPWDDAGEGRALVVKADTPEEAVKVATEKMRAEDPHDGGICWKVARLNLVGFEGAIWELGKDPAYDGFTYYADGINGRPDAPPSRPQPASTALVERPQVLKGVGKINGDGWKDTTKVGEVVFVWNEELPPPYKPGQFPRIGCEHYTASTDQYDFTPASISDIRAYLNAAKEGFQS